MLWLPSFISILLTIKMSKILILIVILSGLSSALYAQSVFQTGDIIFHISKSQQSLSIQKATHSPYSHMGMIVNKNNQTWVLEAIQPVQYTALNQWIARGENAHYVVKRLKQPLNVQQKTKLVQHAEKYLGKPYDIYFEWDDRAIYCSEIVWKAYQHALGIELSPLQQLKQFDLKQNEVQRLMRQRYGQNIPLNEQVIAPKSIYDSKLLKEIFRN
ncbi:YiiX family permuted papain-like enzyme [Acinetobacter sp. SH20PTE14]|uniref:YiiX family permuted papain-like enzyme n=1 Tax=Acinetobacter sp. SH20PTE14 TaxID=2905879 RepID=UPI002DD44B20|nr:YiiX family permuted papain-like enzyme [Acinetobacter sp. SH20PTE14]